MVISHYEFQVIRSHFFYGNIGKQPSFTFRNMCECRADSFSLFRVFVEGEDM